MKKEELIKIEQGKSGKYIGRIFAGSSKGKVVFLPYNYEYCNNRIYMIAILGIEKDKYCIAEKLLEPEIIEIPLATMDEKLQSEFPFDGVIHSPFSSNIHFNKNDKIDGIEFTIYKRFMYTNKDLIKSNVFPRYENFDETVIIDIDSISVFCKDSILISYNLPSELQEISKHINFSSSKSIDYKKGIFEDEKFNIIIKEEGEKDFISLIEGEYDTFPEATTSLLEAFSYNEVMEKYKNKWNIWKRSIEKDNWTSYSIGSGEKKIIIKIKEEAIKFIDHKAINFIKQKHGFYWKKAYEEATICTSRDIIFNSIYRNKLNIEHTIHVDTDGGFDGCPTIIKVSKLAAS